MYLAFSTLTDYYLSVYCFATPLSYVKFVSKYLHWQSTLEWFASLFSAQHQVLNAMFSKSWKPGENIAILSSGPRKN